MSPAALYRAALACALAAGLGACSQAAEPAPAPIPSLTVETVAPRVGELTREVTASGSIAAWEEIAVGAEVSGLRVTEVTVEVGDTVRRGDVLVRLDARTLRAKASQSQAAVAQAQANAEVAQKRAKRIRELAAKHFVSAQDADEAAGDALSADAQLRTMRSALEAAQVELEFTQIRAPHDGVISARDVQPGQVVGSDSELLKLIRDHRLEWRAELAEADLTRVAPGMPVRVSGPNGATVEGRVRQVSPALDTRRRTGVVYADLPAPGPLRAGMFGSGAIALGREPGLLIPLDAVVRRDGRAYAFVVGNDHRARERRIRTAAVAGAYVDVREGLQAGDRVIASGAGFLGDGDLVRVAASDSAAAPAATAREK
ncbi:efflux RND transporter periplasmic adaptor subunit [Lysobacter sp. K5869]|uniref:efflux RND transporter periplasmic adaptor subunit n=1 Tax=Lysobacter sp. K5869 TaxID=2820808 RepID=UPI001C05F112|nr:efflux RND transporter periplasmic adaptor subunit [Lysobacter sp. K5869]QWP75300.1 efflux RND transporter periplasmic adaptor subunit [Lysobacter sp. K5869]